MMSQLYSLIQTINDPQVIVILGWVFVASYYIAVTAFYTGIFLHNGTVDIVTSVIWSGFALILTISLIDLLIHSKLGLSTLLNYYVLFIFFFNFIYSIIEWHFSGQINFGVETDPTIERWWGEIKTLTMSVQIMTGSAVTATIPKSPLAELIASVQALLGLLMASVFIAEAVNVVGNGAT